MFVVVVRRALAFIGFAAMAACTQSEEPSKTAQQPLQLTEAMKPGQCSTEPWSTPRIGSQIDSVVTPQGGEAAPLVATVHSVSGSDVRLEMVRSVRGNKFKEPFLNVVQAGILPGGHIGETSRIVKYQQDPVPILRALAIGESASIPMTEASDFDGELKASRYNTNVTLIACGNLPFQGRERPVLVYRVESYSRAYRRGPPLEDFVRKTVALKYFSPELGVPIRTQWDGGGVEIVETIR